jgi:hypothetical protein
VAYESLDKASWELKWRPDPKYGIHNHPPSTHPLAHYAHRKFDQQQQKTVGDMLKAGMGYFITIYTPFQSFTTPSNFLQTFTTSYKRLQLFANLCNYL